MVTTERQPAGVVLWERFTESRDPAIREQLILQYAPLVKYVIGKLRINLPAGLDYEDILSYGTIGLIEAVERFNPAMGVKFETYAISRVRGAILDTLRSHDRLPRSVRRKARDADAAFARLVTALGRIPTDLEVSAELGIPLKRYLQDKADISRVAISLDSSSRVDEGEIQIVDPDAGDVGDAMAHSELVDDLAGAIRTLPQRDQILLACYYQEELTMREISKVLGVSESRVCQLHTRALAHLRVALTREETAAAA